MAQDCLCNLHKRLVCSFWELDKSARTWTKASGHEAAGLSKPVWAIGRSSIREPSHAGQQHIGPLEVQGQPMARQCRPRRGQVRLHQTQP